MAKRLNLKDSGFTLIEVMIALAIFGVFVVSFMAAQGYNVADSSQIKNEIELKNYAEMKINEVLLNPPEYKESLTLKPETGKLKINEDFKYEIQYKKFIVPDYSKLKGVGDDEEKSASAQIQEKLFNKVKENLEVILWQVSLKITNTINSQEYTISTWVIDPKAVVKLESL